MSASTKVSCTKNYRMFERHSSENRPLDLRKHKKLLASMTRYGFLKDFPIVVRRNESGQLIVKDGQHRLAMAESLALPVWYIEGDVNFDVALVNTTPKIWTIRDYADRFAAVGLEDYKQAIAFSEKHGLQLGTSVSLLAGTTSYSNISEAFMDGKFQIHDQAWAEAVAGIYVVIAKMSTAVKNTRFVEACMAVCRIADFDADRLIKAAERHREKLVNYSTRDAYLEMIEELYNFGRKQLVGVKNAAIMQMRSRNVATRGKRKKSQAADPAEPQLPDQEADAA